MRKTTFVSYPEKEELVELSSKLAKGHYDEKGKWKKHKFCFVSCGNRCDCGPPFGKYQLTEEELKKLNEQRFKIPCP